MGMFNDNVSTQRNSWKYAHSGKELLPYAQKLYQEFAVKEEAARKAMAGFMLDMKVSNSSAEVENAKHDIISFGTLKEQCLVFVYEFTRRPDEQYLLGLGDVTFFGLAE